MWNFVMGCKKFCPWLFVLTCFLVLLMFWAGKVSFLRIWIAWIFVFLSCFYFFLSNTSSRSIFLCVCLRDLFRKPRYEKTLVASWMCHFAVLGNSVGLNSCRWILYEKGKTLFDRRAFHFSFLRVLWNVVCGLSYNKLSPLNVYQCES